MRPRLLSPPRRDLQSLLTTLPLPAEKRAVAYAANRVCATPLPATASESWRALQPNRLVGRLPTPQKVSLVLSDKVIVVLAGCVAVGAPFVAPARAVAASVAA